MADLTSAAGQEMNEKGLLATINYLKAVSSSITFLFPS
jgi:hypothetical protein